MTLDEALKQTDRKEFIKAMHKEIADHIRHKHWKVVARSSVPRGKFPIPMVWSMKRKRNPIGFRFFVCHVADPLAPGSTRGWGCRAAHASQSPHA